LKRKDTKSFAYKKKEGILTTVFYAKHSGAYFLRSLKFGIKKKRRDTNKYVKQRIQECIPSKTKERKKEVCKACIPYLFKNQRIGFARSMLSLAEHRRDTTKSILR